MKFIDEVFSTDGKNLLEGEPFILPLDLEIQHSILNRKKITIEIKWYDLDILRNVVYLFIMHHLLSHFLKSVSKVIALFLFS